MALNDFHGNLLPPSGSSGRVGMIDAGGVKYLSTHIQNLRALNPNTVVVSAETTWWVPARCFLPYSMMNGFAVLTQGTDCLDGEVDTDAFEKYFAANSPVEPGPQNRITLLP